MAEFPFVFVREKEFDRLYIEFTKRARAMLALLRRLEKQGKNFYAIDRNKVAKLEENMRRLEILLTMNETRILSSMDAMNAKTRTSLMTSFNRLAKDIQKIDEKLDSKADNPEEARMVLENDLRALDEKMSKASSQLGNIADSIKKQGTMMEVIFRKRMDSGYLVSDRDLIKTILKVRENIRKGRWKSMPEWAKAERKAVLKELGEKIIMTTEVAIVKELVKGEATEARMLKVVPVSSYTLKKALNRLMKEGYVKKERKGRSAYYMLL